MVFPVLNRSKAIEIHKHNDRAFVFLHQYALTYQDTTEKLKALEHTHLQVLDVPGSEKDGGRVAAYPRGRKLQDIGMIIGKGAPTQPKQK